jgi:hypothetical protein
MPSYDVFICYHPKDEMTFSHCLTTVRMHLQDAKTIYVISKDKPDEEDIVWIPESSYPFAKEDVAQIITGNTRIGWYYQQLLKMYLYKVIPTESEYVLILDSDVMIKEPISFFEDGKLLLSISNEETLSYYSHMERVLPGLQKQTEFSGIVHHMMTKREHMLEILDKIELEHEGPAWKTLLRLVDPEDHTRSGMSEYEIYFNYCLKYHSDKYVYRFLKFANCTSFRELEQKKDAALVALHAWSRA